MNSMNHGFVRVAAAVPKLELANCMENAKRIATLVEKAHAEQVQIIGFPELTVTGYSCADLFHQQLFLEKSLDAIVWILSSTKTFDIICIVGAPILFEDKLFNCAIVLHEGKILGVVPKTYIPNYGEFYEKRWFVGAKEANGHEIELLGSKVPFGNDLLFTIGDTGAVVGIEICEDLWVPSPPSGKQASAGANLLFNLSASNDLVGKYEYRRDLVKMQSGRCMAGYIYASSGLGESSTDTVFGGHAMIAEFGVIVVESQRFQWQDTLQMADVDIQRLTHERYKNGVFSDQVDNQNYRKMKCPIKTKPFKTLKKKIDPHPFVPKQTETLHRRCEEIFDIQTSALQRRFLATGSKKAVIGISGGLDSTLALLVTVRTFERLEISPKQIIAVTMPGYGTTEQTYQNALELMNSLGVTVREINIVKACEQHFKDIGHDSKLYDITYENVQARERTQILMDLANQEGGLVIGTGDLSELALGWSTYNGDHMSMYSVNSGVPKTLVKFLVKWVADDKINTDTSRILHRIIDTPISPELLPPDETGQIHQKTELILGPYELHDFFLYHMIRYGASPKKILYLAGMAFDGKYTKEDIQAWLTVFIKRFFSQQFKRSCLPDGPKVGTISLSPRSDWRMPSDAQAKLWLEDIESKNI